MRTLTLALVLVLAWTAPARAYRHRMPQPAGVTVHYSLNPVCGGYSCADPATGEIWLTSRSDRFTAAHERGHIWWDRVATDSDRAWMIARLGLPANTPWVTGTGTGSRSPNELAADAYAACDLGMSPGGSGPWVDDYGYNPTAGRHRAICLGIAVIGLIRR